MKRREFLALSGATALTGVASGMNRKASEPKSISNKDAKPTRGIVSALSVDHCGFTVPDLNQAVSFFTDVLGGEVLWTHGPSSESPTSEPVSSINLAMLRLGPNINVELLEIKAQDQSKREPVIADYGTPHLAIYVEDLEAADAYMTTHGVTLFHGPNDGAQKGEHFRYFVTPWGMFMELITRTKHPPYEAHTRARLYGPAAFWHD